MRMQIALITGLVFAVLAPCATEARSVGLTFCCDASNDLYTLLTKAGRKCARYASPDAAIESAAVGSAVLVLADGYPATRTKISPAILDAAAAKKLRLYIEYPDAIPGLDIGSVQTTVWERGAVASDDFGESLRKGRILAVQGCHYLPTRAEKPMLVIARIAGFDTAVYGLPENASPLLFELPSHETMIATTKLSGFVTGRYAPTEAWKTIWEHLLARLDPDAPAVSLKWDPTVRPAYGPNDKLPRDAELRSLRARAKWYNESRLLIDATREPSIHKVLAANAPDGFAVPDSKAPRGDGSRGILEGYSSAVDWDGSQRQINAIRADCCAEAAMVLAMDTATNGNKRHGQIAKNLTDFIYFNSGLCKNWRANPKHPAYGMIGWGDVAPAWLVANYGDDSARTILATIAVASSLDSDSWTVPVLKALLANLRTTGPQGFRNDRIDIPELEANGWKYYHDTARTNYALNFEAYLWACYLWAYRQTGYKEFLEKARTALKMTMDAYPNQWRWGDSMERARILLPLAWLVRVDDTPEHRAWLRRIVDDLLVSQDACGALGERLNAAGGGGHYTAPQSNEAYGTSEGPLIQTNNDCASDQLYTTGFALIGLHEGYAATADPVLRNAEDRLAEYLVRIQVRAPKLPYLDGTWFRAFDFKRWEYWASSSDAGWGAWSAETGWAQSWTAMALALRVRNTSLWDMTADVNIAKHFRAVKTDMAQTPEGPYNP